MTMLATKKWNLAVCKNMGRPEEHVASCIFEMNQRKTNIICFYLYVESKNKTNKGEKNRDIFTDSD